MKLLFVTIIACIALASCDGPSKPTLSPENIFDSKDLHVITSLINKRMGTASTLYGNDLALAASQRQIKNHTAGEIYQFVTWKLHPNPYWFGGDINGVQNSLETVEVLPSKDKQIAVRYTRTNNDHASPESLALDKQNRINFIFGQKPSVFP